MSKQRTLLRIAERDGGWKCRYCGIGLVNIDDPACVVQSVRQRTVPGGGCGCGAGTEDPDTGDRSCWGCPDAYPVMVLRAADGLSWPEVEHLIPRSRGGSPCKLDNLGMSCHGCNARKGTMTEAEYRQVLSAQAVEA